MLKVSKPEVFGWESAIRGMRNPKNSWDKIDSHYSVSKDNNDDLVYVIGPNDLKLMKSLSRAGNDHAKFLRMINVTCDITAPLYWWKEYDTYKVGTVASSCSTMHKLDYKEFELDDFSHEHLKEPSRKMLQDLIDMLNHWRDDYRRDTNIKKDYWWQMIQLLPSSYNQKRTVQVNYLVLKSMYFARKNHKLDEWNTFCDWMLTLPYFEEICADSFTATKGVERYE